MLTHTMPVVVVLDAFKCGARSGETTYEWLRIKFQKLHKPFSLSFVHTGTIGKVNHPTDPSYHFNGPSDVKISYRHSLILVTDTLNKRIQAFDLKTLQFKYSIQFNNLSTGPLYMALDEMREDDLVITFASALVRKYSLNGSEKTMVWECRHDQVCRASCGLVIEKSEGNIFVADCLSNCIMVLSAKGELLRNFSHEKMTPFGLAIDNDGDLWVTSFKTHNLYVISKTGKRVYLKIGKAGSEELEFQYPRGIFVENITGQIYVCDQSNHRIQVLSSIYEFVGKFGQHPTPKCKNNELNFPSGLCINERTGELFVADKGNNRIQIFK